MYILYVHILYTVHCKSDDMKVGILLVTLERRDGRKETEREGREREER